MSEDTIMPVIRTSWAGLAEAVRETSLKTGRVMIAGDSNTMPLYAKEVAAVLGNVFDEVHFYTFPAGEEYKQLSSVEGLLRELLAKHFDRGDLIAALGGGVVGDMAGFAASVYLRGIPVLQLPTTLLAQIDSSIGGKTGVDFGGYKNMVGAFHMPSLVYTNTSAIRSLPPEQFRAGMGEVIKSALLKDADFCSWIEDHAGQIAAKDEDALYTMIRRTAQIKVDIVRRDPTEKGERALLNLGHTIGHAVEVQKEFGMLHGDCVAVGLCAAAFMSARRGLLTDGEYRSVLSLCRRFGLPICISDAAPEEILKLTKADKKMAGGRIRFILIRKPGEAFFTDDVSDEELLAGIRSVLSEGVTSC